MYGHGTLTYFAILAHVHEHGHDEHEHEHEQHDINRMTMTTPLAMVVTICTNDYVYRLHPEFESDRAGRVVLGWWKLWLFLPPPPFYFCSLSVLNFVSRNISHAPTKLCHAMICYDTT